MVLDGRDSGRGRAGGGGLAWTRDCGGLAAAGEDDGVAGASVRGGSLVACATTEGDSVRGGSAGTLATAATGFSGATATATDTDGEALSGTGDGRALRPALAAAS